MEEKELTTLLSSHDLKQSRRTWRCPDENQLAAYVNGQLPDRQKLEKHLADCKPCLQTTAFLLKEVDKSELVPAVFLARARSLAENARAVKWNWGWSVAAAAACLLIVASIGLWQRWSTKTARPSTELVAQVKEPPLPGKGTPANANSSVPVPSPHVEKPKVRETQTAVIRSAETGPKLTLVFPREGSTVRLPLQSLRWAPLPDATFYEVKIVTEDGASVLTQSTNITELPLPADALKPGSKYFVTVVAHLSGNRTIRSDLVKFRVAEAR
jgi:hypothetical protein